MEEVARPKKFTHFGGEVKLGSKQERANIVDWCNPLHLAMLDCKHNSQTFEIVSFGTGREEDEDESNARLDNI